MVDCYYTSVKQGTAFIPSVLFSRNYASMASLSYRSDSPG